MRGVFAADPARVAIVESALIFEVEKWGTGAGWLQRFDKLILVTVPDEVKIARFVARAASGNILTQERQSELEAEARRRLAQQIPDEQKSALCDYVLTNGGALVELEWQVDQLWPLLKVASESFSA